jgi:hypothetical protein
VAVRLGIDQLHIDAHSIARFLDAAFENVSHAKLFRDLRQILGRAFITKGRCAGNHLQIPDLRETRENFVLNAFGEIDVRLVLAQGSERQDGNRFRGGSDLAAQISALSERKRPPRHPPEPNCDSETQQDNGCHTTSARGRAFRVGRTSDPLRCQLERPGENESDGKTEKHQYHHQSYGPGWDLENGKGRGRDLNNQPANDGVGDGHPVDMAPFQFGKELTWIHSLRPELVSRFPREAS